jgi:hypothetical protein
MGSSSRRPKTITGTVLSACNKIVVRDDRRYDPHFAQMRIDDHEAGWLGAVPTWLDGIMAPIG